MKSEGTATKAPGERMFPVLLQPRDTLQRLYPGCPRTVPWGLLEPHELQARRNHGDQTLERLAERGGLDPTEMFYVLHNLPYPIGAAVDLKEAIDWVVGAITRYLAGRTDAAG